MRNVQRFVRWMRSMMPSGGRTRDVNVTRNEINDLLEEPKKVNREDTIIEFQRLLDENEIEHFTSVEVLTMGRSHYQEESLGYQQNSLPPVQLWDNIIPTVRILDKLRTYYNSPVIITNGYRNETYNDLIGGSTNSQHKEFRALDFYVKGHEPMVVSRKLQEWRIEGKFTGGIGTYKTFTHLDTRGYNATWEN